jgi:hypothetical protein
MIPSAQRSTGDIVYHSFETTLANMDLIYFKQMPDSPS